MVHIYPPRQRLEGFEAKILKLVSYCATPDQWKAWIQVPLKHAAACGDLDLVTRLLEAGAGDRVSGWRGCRRRTALGAAALGGNAEVVSALLLNNRARSDLNVVSVSSGRSALYLAVICGHEAAARELIIAGHDVNHRDPADQCGLLYTAVSDGHEQLVRHLLEAGACPNARHSGTEGYTPLHIACSRGHTSIISALLAGGADKDAKDNRGAIPLHHTISQDHVAATESLLAAGANITIGGSFTPFVLAALERNTEILKLFLMRGVDVNFRDESGSTALHAAAIGNLSSCSSPSSFGGAASAISAIDALMDAGADVDAQRLDGGAPLHYAAAFTSLCSCFDVILALLRRGASVDLVHSKTGQTPLHVACQHKKRGVDAVVDLLLRWGADEAAVGGDGRTALELLEIDMCGRQGNTSTGAGNGGLQEQLAREEEVDRARALLTHAGEDRAWRRRCLPVMLRWREGRARPTHTSCTGMSIDITTDDSRGTWCTTTRRGGGDASETIRTRPTSEPGAPGIETGKIATGTSAESFGAGGRWGRESGGGRGNCVGSDETTGHNEPLRVVMAVLIGMASQGVFRKIVGFL